MLQPAHEMFDWLTVDHGPMKNHSHHSGTGNSINMRHWCSHKIDTQLCNTETLGMIYARETECCDLHSITCTWQYSGLAGLGGGYISPTKAGGVGISIMTVVGSASDSARIPSGQTSVYESFQSTPLFGYFKIPRGWKQIGRIQLISYSQGYKAEIWEIGSLECNAVCIE